ALERWRHASSGLRELFAGVPSTQRALSAALERQLDLGEPEIGLRFSASEQHAEQVVGLAQAWAFVHKHPNLAAALDRPCVVTGLSKQHPLSTLTPLQLLTRLHNLDPQQALEQSWNAHWDGRAPGTPLSRRERASQLYRIHLEATAHVALAQRTLSAEQLRPLWLLMDDTSASPQPVRAERVDLLLSNDTRVTLPDAWVISVGDSQNGAQLLYLPKQAVALQAFAKRADLQAWLGRQGLVPKGLPASDLRFEYSPRALPLTQGMTDLLSHWQQARLAALRGATPNRPGLAEHGAQVLDQARQLDRQLSVGGVFAVPPTSFNSPSEATDDEPLWFGALHADIPWPVRKAAVARQQAALEHWSQHASAEQRQTLDQRFQTLESAEADADAAAYKLLYRERALDLVTLNREFTALHGAHKKALLAEADLQHTLKQLSDDEHQTLKHILQLPGESEPAREGASATTEEITEKTTGNPCVASLSLSLIEQANSTRTALNGPWIITETAALHDPESPHSLLLIWPGAGGGVQRFANRRALEREVFKRHAQDAELVVQLTPISGDPLHHALHEMTFEFDEQLASLRQRYSEPAQATQLAEQLETLRQRFRAALQVPVSGARQLALAHLQEQRRSATLADNLPDWLRNLSLGTRSTLKQLIEHYIGAMQRSHALLEIALPPREPFTRQHLHERLRKDFSLKGEFDIQLDLPDSVATEKHTVPAPGAPGTPVKLVLVPSKTRSKIALLELAQQNLDNTPSMSLEPMQLRLGFLRVEATASSEAERQTLVRGITKAYLNRVLPELDLAKAYETLIRQAFMGSSDDPPFVNQHRRECLLEPWGLMLRLQGEYARLQQHISADEQRIFDAAIDGQSAEASSV
ncbi:dermonecrotic toxin domain-containing protein, partial [Pseudomonas koreensis]|nr:hypothetical protein [Pseudomonas koreensis]